MLDEKGVDPYADVLSEERYRELFGYNPHPFTGVDYVAYYKQLITDCGCDCEIVFANSSHRICRIPPNFRNAGIEYSADA